MKSQANYILDARKDWFIQSRVLLLFPWCRSLAFLFCLSIIAMKRQRRTWQKGQMATFCCMRRWVDVNVQYKVLRQLSCCMLLKVKSEGEDDDFLEVDDYGNDHENHSWSTKLKRRVTGVRMWVNVGCLVCADWFDWLIKYWIYGKQSGQVR